MNFPEPSTVVTSRGPVAYIEEGAGDSILCIHGAMGGYDQSMALGRTIGPAGFRYLAVSRPGFPGTPLSGGKTPGLQADLHAAFLDSLNVDTVVVMAISGGGPSAVNFALRHPDRCSKLVLCSTIAQEAPQKIPISFTIMTALAGVKPLMQSMKSKIEANLESSVARSITNDTLRAKVMADRETLALFNVVNLGMFDNMGKRIAGTRADIRISARFSAELEKVTTPTLVIHGDRDPLVPFERHGKVLAERIPGARLYIARDGEHASIFTHREEIRQVVANFVSENENRDA